MKNTKYNKIADKYKVPEDRVMNAFVAFFSGGVVGMLGEIEIEILCHWISRTEANNIMVLTFIFLASLFTALGFFDKLVMFCKSGLIIPITGFAHSMTSAFMDYRKEGFVYGVGSNAFKLAGTVIVYGVLSAWIFGMVRFFIGG